MLQCAAEASKDFIAAGVGNVASLANMVMLVGNVFPLIMILNCIVVNGDRKSVV